MPNSSALVTVNWRAIPDSDVVFLEWDAQKYSKDGRLLMTLGNKARPSDSGHRIGRDREIFESIASITRAAPPFNLPTGVAVSSTGDVFVSDGYGNARVHRFDPEGKLLFSWGEPGAKPGQFRLPHNIWIDREDRVWISDRENNRVQIFNTEGKLLDVWIDLIRPTQVCTDADDTVYISELCRRISIFSIEGKLLARWGNEDYFFLGAFSASFLVYGMALVYGATGGSPDLVQGLCGEFIARLAATGSSKITLRIVDETISSLNRKSIPRE